MARIDVHHHLVAPKLQFRSCAEWGVPTPHLASIMNEKDALEDMDKAGVTLALNSATLPGNFGEGRGAPTISRENQRLHGAVGARITPAASVISPACRCPMSRAR